MMFGRPAAACIHSSPAPEKLVRSKDMIWAHISPHRQLSCNALHWIQRVWFILEEISVVVYVVCKFAFKIGRDILGGRA